jgi:hypothetical protein
MDSVTAIIFSDRIHIPFLCKLVVVIDPNLKIGLSRVRELPCSQNNEVALSNGLILSLWEIGRLH